jgi:superfamily I DNA/RNA helicase
MGPESMTQQMTLDAIEKWETEALKRTRNPGAIADKRECLEVFALAGPNLGAAIAYAEHVLFKSEGTINLISGHKSKGHEWDNVFHLDPWRIPSKWASPGTEAFEQELNVRYVIETRAKQTLNLISMEAGQ